MVKTINGKAVRTYRTGYRTFLKQLLSREKAYSVADYARKASKATGRIYTEANVRSALKRMAKSYTISYKLTDGDNGAQYVTGCVWGVK
ncbi:MAG: hypothetical protein ACYTFK_13745 [Planctomycetota bacterium]|jgi:hypothetical protein